MIDTHAPTETLAIPVGGLSEANVRLNFGGGELTLHPAAPGTLVSGTFEGGVIQKSRRAGSIELEPAPHARSLMVGCRLHWDVGLTAEIPVDLEFNTGGNRSVIDLTPLRIRRIALRTGASETNLRLPATGQTQVSVECGFAAVNVEVPQGVAARIHGKLSLGSTEVDITRFPPVADGWSSPDYDVAANRADIRLSGGFGSVRIS